MKFSAMKMFNSRQVRLIIISKVEKVFCPSQLPAVILLRNNIKEL